ncbi:MAG TPA: hypothetical protein ACFCUD_09020 [Cyclobacteriaceae bacterium]
MSVIQPHPPGFEDQVYRFSFHVSAGVNRTWDWLNDPKTFTETQFWPFVVEFYSPEPEVIPTGFHEGVLTNHYGPFLNFAGLLTKIKHNKYRDLQYYYGSYAINFMWIRPYRLEFWVQEEHGKTLITCAVSCYVKPFIANFWWRLQKTFWKRFEKWAQKSLRK